MRVRRGIGKGLLRKVGTGRDIERSRGEKTVRAMPGSEMRVSRARPP